MSHQKFNPSAFATNRSFIKALSVIFLAGLILNSLIEFSLQNPHPFWLNVFFINYTFLGDGFFAICLVAYFLVYLKKKKTALQLTASILLTTIIVQIIKNLFSNAEWQIFFEQGQYLFFTDESTLANTHAFPSAHTAIGFAWATVLLLKIQHKIWQIPGIIAMILLGVSRLYLAQHSIMEVVAGALIGSMAALAIIYLPFMHIQTSYYLKKWVSTYFGREIDAKSPTAAG